MLLLLKLVYWKALEILRPTSLKRTPAHALTNVHLKEGLRRFLQVAEDLGWKDEVVFSQMLYVMGRSRGTLDQSFVHAANTLLRSYLTSEKGAHEEFWGVMSNWIDQMERCQQSPEQILGELRQLMVQGRLPPEHPLGEIFNC